MPTIYNDDKNTLGYWLDEYNGITGRLGFFHILYIMSLENQSHPEIDYLSYPVESGNPIMEWADMYESDPGIYRSKGIEYNELDNLFMDRSGLKIFRNRFIQRMSETEPGVSLAPIVERITREFSKKWLDLWQTMFLEYNPIENYNMVEETEKDKTRFTNGKIVTYQGTETNGYDNTDQKKAFNSENWLDTDKQSGSNTLTYGTGNNARKDVNSGTDLSEREYKFTRSGNIGVTTSQQMLEAERKIKMYEYFNEVVFPDIDKQLVLSVY